MTVAEAMTCRELVELVTDYLEGALPAPTAAVSSSTSATARTATPTWSRSAS